ncbi:hypothetical protein ABE504_21605 [Paenibacillus oryzisoli]|uniref:hypothetical protein n=1 Tax=Paenibacillus oryzisoli TaxID=1850517 RepID=UPI003D2CC8F6
MHKKLITLSTLTESRYYRVNMNTVVALVGLFLLPVAYMIALSLKTEGVPRSSMACFYGGGKLEAAPCLP